MKQYLWGVSIAIVVLFVAIVVMINQPFMRIGEIAVIGNETVHDDDIAAAVHDVIDPKVLWIFPRDTVLFYPRKEVRDTVLNSFSRIELAAVNITNFDQLVVTVHEHQPEFLWCRSLGEASLHADDCYYMDQESYIFGRAPYFTDHVYLKFLGAHIDVPDDPRRSTVYDMVELEQLLELRGLLADRGIEINKISVESYDDYILFVDLIDNVRVGPGAQLLVNLGNTTNNIIIEDLSVAFRTAGFVEKLRTYPERLEYIDLRFPDKIVYRFKSGTPDVGPLVDSEE